MDRAEASKLCREELNKYGLTDWSVRLNQNAEAHFLGLCSYKDKCIILSAHHIDIHPTPDVVNTIYHEIAHALTPHHGHDEVWATKAREIGCDNTTPCSNLSLSPEVIDAIRSGATVEVTFDEQVIRTPKYNITRLQDKCEFCGKVAKTKSESTVEIADPAKPDLKFIYLECGHTLVRKIPKGTPFGNLQWGGDANCKHTWDKNSCTTCGRFRPYQFQLDGMKFLEAGLAVNNGAACFDEMGLGKTIQAEGLIYFHPEYCPVLWLVKSGTKWQFAASIVTVMGDSHVPQVIETSQDFLIPGLKHYIIGYDMLVQKSRTLKSGKVVTSGFDITKFEKAGIKLVVLDECQQIKNADSSRTQQVRKVVKGKKVLPLSGTPWKNRGSELYPVLNMMDPMKFPSFEKFKRDWVAIYWEGKYQKEGGIKASRLPAFKEYTKDMCVRRERTEVMKELPLVNRTKLIVRMTPSEEQAYDAAVEEFIVWYEAQMENISGMHILAAMQKMRHLVALAKLPATVEYVHEFIEDTDRKIVVFVHHKDVAHLLMHEFKECYEKGVNDDKFIESIPVLKISSDMNSQARFETQQQFNSSPRAILIASTLAAGEGLNLQTCSDCILHERQWNPANEEQAEGRFIRIGQKADSVNAVYAHAEGLNTIDPKLDAINERKRAFFHAGMNNSEAPKWNEESFGKELAEAIIAGHKRKKGMK